MARKRGSRSRRTKDRIAEGMRRYRAKQREERAREERENPKPKVIKEIPQAKKDTLGFHRKDTRENLIVFPIKDIVANVIFDFERECIKIEIPGVFGLTLGNQTQEVMENLARVLNRNYKVEKRDRLELVKKLKFPRSRKAILDKILNDIVRTNDEQSG